MYINIIKWIRKAAIFYYLIAAPSVKKNELINSMNLTCIGLLNLSFFNKKVSLI